MTESSILVTGFEPFDRSNENPSARVVKQLASSKVDGARVIAQVLPVSARRSPAIMLELLEKHRLLDGKRFLARCTDRGFLRAHGIAEQSVEGYLLPGTYNVEPDMDESGLTKAMLGQFTKNRRAKYDARLKASGKTWHEILTLASMIEKEAVAPAERPVIASVFYNRLARGMRLQSDPTSVYGVRAFAGKVTRADILRPSPYNTYLNEGLPPGPIGNPGDSAIEAALTPVRTSYLYFVARQDGSHQFSTTLVEHNRAVQTYLK